MGIEPTTSAWKAEVLPLNYTRMVGVAGFEPATPCSQGRCATKLRYTPNTKGIIPYWFLKVKYNSHKDSCAKSHQIQKEPHSHAVPKF